MAKNRRSQRNRRVTTDAQPDIVDGAPKLVRSKDVEFAVDYFYVYTEVRNVFVVAVVMFGVLFGLGYFI